MKLVAPQPAAMDRVMQTAEQEYGEVVIVEYLGSSIVSADTFWEHPALAKMTLTEGDEKPLDELFEAAIAVQVADEGKSDETDGDAMLLESGSAAGGGGSDFVMVGKEKKEKGLEDTAGVLFADHKPIAVMKVLSKEVVTKIVPAMIIDARVFDRYVQEGRR